MEQKTIDIYDLTGVMLDLDSARTILGEVSEDFFNDLDPGDKKDWELMACGFSRARAKHRAVLVLLYEMEKELEKLGADTGYRREKQ